MIRSIRLFLYFVVGVLLSSVVVISHAETISATSGTDTRGPVSWCGQTSGGAQYYKCAATPEGACSASNDVWNASNPANMATGCQATVSIANSGTKATANVPYTYSGQTMYMWSTGDCPAGYDAVGGVATSAACKKTGFICPDSTWTLSGSTCTRPDCRADQTRDSSGLCSCPAGKNDTGTMCVTSCPEGYHSFTPDDGRCEKNCIGRQVQGLSGVCKCDPGVKNAFSFAYDDGKSFGNCNDGCLVNTSSASFCPGLLAKIPAGNLSGVTCYTYGTTTGEICGANSTLPPEKNLPITLVPAAPAPTPTAPTTENPNPPAPDPKETADNNKNPGACAASGGVYYSVGGVGKCGTPANDNSMDKLTIKEKKTIKTNPDGTSSETTETIKTIQNPNTGETVTDKGTTTTTKDAAGNVTGTGTETSSGKGDGAGEEPGQCAKEPNSPMCKKGVPGEKGKYDGQSAKIEEAKAELRAKFAEVRAAASALFSGSLGTGGGALPCYPPITVLGKSWSLCFSKFSNELSVIGTFVMLSAAVSAAFIVLRR